MERKDYICKTCGFNSLEKPGAYKCPKCGDKMTVANHSMYNNDRTKHDDNNTLTILAFLFALPISIILCISILHSLWGIIPGVIIFIIILMLLPSDTKDKAIPIAIDYCPNCGVEVDHSATYCQGCGEKIK